MEWPVLSHILCDFTTNKRDENRKRKRYFLRNFKEGNIEKGKVRKWDERGEVKFGY